MPNYITIPSYPIGTRVLVLKELVFDDGSKLPFGASLIVDEKNKTFCMIHLFNGNLRVLHT